MSEHDIVMTEADFKRLNDLVESRDSRALGSMNSLKSELQRGHVVAPTSVDKDVVTMNSRVRVRDLDSKKREVYTLAYPYDADIEEGKISVLAPLGAALLGAKVQQVIECPTPRGVRRLKIERILYQPEAAGDFHL